MRLGERFFAADIEANRWINFLMLGVFTGSEYHVFSKVSHFLTWALRKEHHNVRIYFHNGGRYDFLFFLRELIQNENYSLKYVERQGRLIAITVYGQGFRVQFADSIAILPASLEKLIDAFHVPHKKIAVDFSKDRKYSDVRLRRHLENDCRALYEILCRFQSSTVDGEIKLTIASQALHLFRAKYFPSELTQMRASDEDRFRERFYSGGRVEVFRSYGKRLKYYDVNSLYPWAMTFPMPIGEYRKVRRRDKRRIGFYTIRLETPTDFFATPLLVKGTAGNFYVNGKRGDEFHISSAELAILVDAGVRFSVVEGFEFSDSIPIFQDYVSDLFKEKQANKGTALYTINKLLLNSLYGKLGASRYVQEIQDYRGQEFAAEFSAELNLVLVWTKRRSKFILPYLAAYITAIGRARHLRLLLEAPEKLFYCDTDSIITKADYPIGEKLGELSLKGRYDEGIFLLPKSYALRKGSAEEVVLKGFDSDDFTFAQLEKALRSGSTLQSKRERILSFRESFKRRNGIIRSRGPFLNMVETIKTFDPAYSRRKLIPSRTAIFETRPFTVDELSR